MKSNKTKSAMTALVIAAMLCSAAMPIRAAEAQWVNNNGTWSYVKEDGSKAKGWIKDNNCWYAFDDNGAMRTGWIASNEHWYFMGESGVMQADAWVEDNGARYYIKGTGVMAKDYVKDGYELTEDGKAIPLAESKSVVLTDPEAIEGEVIEGNLYVDVTTAKALELKGVTVKGKLVVIGDNQTAGKLTITDSKIEAISTQTRNTEVVLSGETEVKTIVLEETAAVTPDKNFKGEVEKIEVQSTTKGEIVIEVPAQEVSTRTYASVDIQAPVESLEVKTDTQIKVNADVKNVVVTESAKDTKVEVSKGSTVGTITADAPVKIEGSGTINKVEANVDGVEAGKDTVIKDVETGKDVEQAPEVNKPSTGGSTGGSGGGGGSITPTKSETEKFKEAFDKELNGDFKANAENNGVTFTVENDPVHDCIVINGTVKDTSKNLWNFTKETILDSIVRVDLAYTNIQSVRISFNGNTTGDILMTDLRTISPENLEKWGKDLFKKDSKEELLKLTLADIVDSSSFAVQFTIANKEVVNYVIPLHEENLEKEAIENLKKKVAEAVGNVKTNDLATITMPDSVKIHTEFLSGETTISQITGTGIFSILTTLTDEGVTGYTFNDSSTTNITGTPTYEGLLTLLTNYLGEDALNQKVSALVNKNIVVTVAYKDANGAEVNVEYTFTFAVSENIED
ncbi:N-acetylmuramoyl-L-alanine amidase family protein [Dielma fastidiosa]|uniref:N-acetylmuramoyl-L-alanine amidase family protein n=1 Tax=Dielma fastidiosa TaxID=1034346 RepID=UPI000E49A664|nr:N-acetylmuramoyl-L-alanine amidase family protein [Dielma fastidiosa]RHM99015.1 N-acetylmuramoyl-L-alanine amidase family protein [Dielma fastidiosa]